MARFSTVLLALAGAALLGLPTAQAAPAGAGQETARAEAFTSPMKLLKTSHEIGNGGGLALPASTITPYGSALTVNCTVASGCYVMIEAEVQVASTATEGSTALCLRVDGSNTDVCPFLTRTSTANYTSFSHRGGMAVTAGTHTITTGAYTAVASSLHNFNTKVSLFKP